MRKKRVLVLGSTGSIGTQTLQVLAEPAFAERFEVAGLAADRSADLLVAQAVNTGARALALTHPSGALAVPDALSKAELFLGENALLDICGIDGVDLAVVAVVGIAGLEAVLKLLGRGIPVLLANKEALVTGGELVMALAKQTNTPLLPVDSEHSAIFQCLQARPQGESAVEKLLLTASGGPFRTNTREEAYNATVEQALRHPNWSMGRKITVDSATMMNKALEVMEASLLFGVPKERIRVLVHPQSIVHSAVEFCDGAVLAQMGVPDMRLPIAYALTYPERLPLPYKKLDLFEKSLTFEPPDEEKFPALRLGREVMELGGVMPAVLNGANEAAVAAFLEGKIPLGRIAQTVEAVMQRVPNRALTLENIKAADQEARAAAQAILQ